MLDDLLFKYNSNNMFPSVRYALVLCAVYAENLVHILGSDLQWHDFQQHL
jgi:hypothetical protein